MHDFDISKDFQDSSRVLRIASLINRIQPNRQINIMHVCGTHENALCQYGLRQLLPQWLRLVAGPGCPVCVCPTSDIDLAVRLCLEYKAIVASYGDMIKVPSKISLFEAKSYNCDVRVVYTNEDVIEIARQNPYKEVVFFAVGFETTACTTSAFLKRDLPPNISILCSHRLIPPALSFLLDIEELALDGFLLPGHVSTIIGLEGYQLLADKRKIPMTIAGFEPVDIMLGIYDLVLNICNGKWGISNTYTRAVRPMGNQTARTLMKDVFEECDAFWRGIGMIPMSGLRLKKDLSHRDAIQRFGLKLDSSLSDMSETKEGCLCGLILVGLKEPEDCPLFGKVCEPDNPIGPCMVGSEGTCHARFRNRNNYFL